MLRIRAASEKVSKFLEIVAILKKNKGCNLSILSSREK